MKLQYEPIPTWSMNFSVVNKTSSSNHIFSILLSSDGCLIEADSNMEPVEGSKCVQKGVDDVVLDGTIDFMYKQKLQKNAAVLFCVRELHRQRSIQIAPTTLAEMKEETPGRLLVPVFSEAGDSTFLGYIEDDDTALKGKTFGARDIYMDRFHSLT